MAAKRRANGTRQSTGPEAESPFVNITWGAVQDREFDVWLDSQNNPDLATLVDDFLREGLTVKLGSQGGSTYCTVDSAEARAAGTKHLLSGWSDCASEAIQIAWFKWESLLLKIWDHPTAEAPKSRRR